GVRCTADQAPDADPNTLDDYGEGTWTPTLTFAAPGDLAVSYSARSGYYLKIGRLVFLSGTVETSSFTHSTASGLLTIAGAPFAAASPGPAACPGSLYFGGFTKPGYTQFM